MGEREERSISEQLAELAEKLEAGEISMADMAEGNSSISVYERPEHLAQRARNPPNTNGLNAEDHVWLAWDEFKTKDPEFPHYHKIEDGCGRENATPCVLTTIDRATSAWFLADPCPFCYGNGKTYPVDDESE